MAKKHKLAIDPLPFDFTSGKQFYVYLYLDPRPSKRRQPIYVGKGLVKNARADEHWVRPAQSKNPFLSRILDKIRTAGLEPIVEIISAFDNEADAFSCEIALIKRFGRRDQRRGSLCNLTDGGEGLSGRPWSPEHREYMSATMRGRIHSPETRAKVSAAKKGKPGHRHTPAHRARVSDWLTGRPVSSETRAKLSAKASGRSPSPETRALLSALGKGRIVSSETRARLSIAISAARKLKPLSEKQRAHLDRLNATIDSTSRASANAKGLITRLNKLAEKVSFHDIIREYVAGATINTLHKRYHIDQRTVQRILKQELTPDQLRGPETKWRSRAIQTPKGKFASATLAAKYFGMIPQVTAKLARTGEHGWFYIDSEEKHDAG